MFQVKICGITNVDDALMVARLGVDAIGLNFYPKSKRCVTPKLAAEISQTVAGRLSVVGVFVNSPNDQILETVSHVKLDFLQLHGEETSKQLQLLSGLPIIKAFRPQSGESSSILEYVRDCNSMGASLTGLLIDGYSPLEYGGTGQTANWGQVAKIAAQSGLPPLILAGGLNPSNVYEAIQMVRPIGVDTASGVETSPGEKSEDLIRKFTSAVHSSFSAIKRQIKHVE